MKNIKHYTVVSLLVLAVAFAPLTGFAKENNSGKGKDAKIEAKIEHHANNHDNSIWSRIWSNWFGKKAKAANNNSTPSISGITAPTVLKTGQEGKWTVKAADPNNGSLSYMVDWGDVNSSSSAKMMAESAFVQTNTFTHTYDNPGTYTVKFTVENEAGKKTSSSTTVRVTGKKVEDKKNPVITSLSGPSSVDEDEEVTVTVKAYDPKNDSLTYSVNWGDNFTTALKSMNDPFVQTSTFSHVYDEPGTYTATFTAKNSAGLKDTETMKITVKDVNDDDEDDTTAPKITGNVGLQIGSTSATVNWTTDEASDSHVYYSTNSSVDESDSHVSNNSDVTSHSLNLSGLSTSTLYHFILKSSDSSGNTVTSTEFTFTTSS